MQKGIVFLRYVADRPGIPYGTAATVVKVQGTQGMKIRQELENKGLIRIEHRPSVRGKRSMRLWPTDEGLRSIGRAPRKDGSNENPQNPEENGNVPLPVAENADRKDPPCKHFWRLDGGNPPSGPISVGECRECGVKKEFSNRGYEY